MQVAPQLDVEFGVTLRFTLPFAAPVTVVVTFKF